MKTIGVVGAGVMGKGIALAFAKAGFDVILIDIKQSILDTARIDMLNDLRLASLFNKENSEITASEKVVGRILLTTDYMLLRNSHLVIETVTEKWEIKKAVFEKLEDICSENCIFTSNTSSISIGKLAMLTKRKPLLVGTHFMNPVLFIKDIELIRSKYTSQDTIDRVKDYLESIGKGCIVVNDKTGFVANRISHLLMNEAANIIGEGVAEAVDIDEIFRKCYGHKMGPLETADLIGIDTVVNTLDVLHDSYRDEKYMCSPLLKSMVKEDKLGRKNGLGFYKYT